MLFVKRYLVFGFIKNMINTVATVVYKVLSFFHLELTLLIAVLGCILEIAFGIILKSQISFTEFHLIITCTIVYAIIRTLMGVLGFLGLKKRPKKNTAEIVVEEKQLKKNKKEFKNEVIEEKKEIPVYDEKPKYYRVKQNPKYVMAEYIDRYELFLDTGNGYQYVRTDYKGE